MAYDNAVLALGKICQFHRDSIDSIQVVPAWLNCLPIKGDLIEAKVVHDQLCSMAESFITTAVHALLQLHLSVSRSIFRSFGLSRSFARLLSKKRIFVEELEQIRGLADEGLIDEVDPVLVTNDPIIQDGENNGFS